MTMTDPQRQLFRESPAVAGERPGATSRLRLRGGRLFRHSAMDGVLVLLTLLNCAAIVATAYFFSALGPWALAGLALFFVLMICTNYQCIAHNFIHNPFFRAEPLNRLFSVLNSLALGMPQTLYRAHHLNHHQFNNDYRGEDGETGDFSSLYRYSSRDRVPESLWRYSLLGPLRTDFGRLHAMARQKKLAWLVWCESAALLLFYAGLAWLDWRFFLFYFVPVSFLGQAAALAENYLEHYGATPGDRRTDSVSCYGRLYNLLWFNNGYHQEHHYRPFVHWRLVPRLRAEMLPERQRRVVRGSHLNNLFNH